MCFIISLSFLSQLLSWCFSFDLFRNWYAVIFQWWLRCDLLHQKLKFTYAFKISLHCLLFCPLHCRCHQLITVWFVYSQWDVLTTPQTVKWWQSMRLSIPNLQRCVYRFCFRCGHRYKSQLSARHAASYPSCRTQRCDKVAMVVGRTKLTTLTIVDVPLQNFSKSRIWDRVPEESTTIFGDTQVPL